MLEGLLGCHFRCQQAFWHYCHGTVTVLTRIKSFEFSLFDQTFLSTYTNGSNTYLRVAAPSGASLEPPHSSHAILAVRYELRSSLIAMVQEKPFSRDEDENPYTHLCDFEQLCLCIHIQGMRWDTLKWKLFPFSFTGIAKLWYTRHVESVKGEWERCHPNSA